MSRSTRVDRVPNWLSLERYKHLRDLDAGGWVAVIDALLLLQSMLEDEPLPPFFYDRAELEYVFEHALDDPDSEVAQSWRSAYAPDPNCFDFRGVCALSNGTVAGMAASLEKLELGKHAIMLARAKERSEETGNRDKELELLSLYGDRLHEFCRRPFFLDVHAYMQRKGHGRFTPHRTISVNMELPDAMLVEDFKAWLDATRRLELTKAARRPFQRRDFDTWYDDMYAPLILLQLWQQATKEQITLGAIVEALFPERRRVMSDNLRRSILPRAKAWFSYETQVALVAQTANSEP